MCAGNSNTSSNTGYLRETASQASLTATQDDTTGAMRSGAQHIVITTDNLQRWLKTLNVDAHALLKNPTDRTGIEAMITLANEANNGASHGDSTGAVDQSQAGARQAYLYAQAMETLQLMR
jgi:hypothetical protein